MRNMIFLALATLVSAPFFEAEKPKSDKWLPPINKQVEQDLDLFNGLVDSDGLVAVPATPPVVAEPAATESSSEVQEKPTSLTESQSKSQSAACDCDCPTADEVADKVVEKISPLLVAENKATGEKRQVATSLNAPFQLSPGERLVGYERVPGSGVIVPIDSREVVWVNGVSSQVTQHRANDVIIRTAQKSTGEILGQVRGTCQQVWDPVLRRVVRRCN